MAKRTVTIEAFELWELEGKAKERALEFMREEEADALHDQLLWYFQEELAARGYPIENVEWSLNYCQGDGVAFYGEPDTTKIITEMLPQGKLKKNMLRLLQLKDYSLEELMEISISRNSLGYRYSHSRTMGVSTNLNHDQLYNKPRIRAILAEFASWILEDIRDVSKEMERYGYNICYETTSEAALTEVAGINELLFDELGRVIVSCQPTEND